MSSADDDEMEEEVEVTDEDLLLLDRLQSAVDNSPADYGAHANFVAALSRLRVRTRLHDARIAMASRFPLGEQAWLEWLDDEVQAASSADDVDAISDLYERAVSDFLSVRVWCGYIEFLQAIDASSERLRGVCERAVVAGGLHFWLGHDIWAAYRAAEQRGGSGNGQVVESLYRRELSVPLSTIDATLAEFNTLGLAAGDLAAVAAKSAESALARLPLEEPLRPPASDAGAEIIAARGSDAALLAAYMALIEHELRDGNPGRIMTAYERAIAEFPFTVGLWQRYTSYLTTTLGCAAAGAASDRATRTCPWAGDVWATALRNAERRGDAARVEALYAGALASPLQHAEDHIQVGLARMDAARRAGRLDALRAAALAALDGADAACGAAGHVDATLRVPAYWAHCEAGADPAAGREVWEQMLKRPAYGASAETWLAYAAHERAHGGLADARKVFKRCYARRLECAAGVPPAGASCGQQAVCQAWLRMERELGTSDDYAAAEAKVAPILEALASAAAAAQAAAAPKTREPAPKLTPEEIRRMRREKDPNYKAPAPDAALGSGKRREAARQHRSSPKRARPGDAAESGPAHDSRHRGDDQLRGDEGDATDVGAHNALPAPEPSSGVRHSAALTVFVKNVPIGATPEQLQAVFVHAGVTPAFVRVPRDHNTGAGRGFAYVEFSSEDNLASALAVEHPTLDGNELVLARSKPPAGGSRGGHRGGRGGGIGSARGRGRPAFGRQPHLAVDGDQADGAKAASKPQPRSNADFRALFLRRGGGAESDK